MSKETLTRWRLTLPPLPEGEGLKAFFSAFSGFLLALAFPKLDLWWVAWIALAPFFWALNKSKSWKESLLCGLAFGLFFFGVNFFWAASLARFVGGWAWFGWGCLVIFQTLFILLFVLISRLSSMPVRQAGIVYRPFVIPLAWVAVEWLRSWGPFGMTVGVVGYSQADFLQLIQIASFASVYGVSFLVVLVNAAVAEFILDRRKWFSVGFAVILIAVALLYGFSFIGHWSLVIGHFPRLALLQPGIDQLDKMNPRLVVPIYEIHEKMTRDAAKSKPDIIIWPETAVFTYLLQDPVLFPRLQRLAKEVNAWLIVGTPYYDGKGKVYNSMVSISPSGEVASRYDKEKLVPFGEYLPFRNLLYPFLKSTGYFDQDFNSNPNPQPVVAGKFKVAPAICFESTFPDLIRKRVGKDSDFILTITNDAWFDDSAAPYFHLNTGIFRAIENRKYFVQVGNTGFSAIIDPYGRVIKKSRLNERESLRSAPPGSSRSNEFL